MATPASEHGRARSIFDAATSFTANHLSQWVATFARSLRDHGGSGFYAAAADALACFAAADCSL